ncbi:uncharacterized protein CG13380-like [Drosophila willistoni]|uniref:uncharacterized protein CG13380-like n=1 Tax=Drosophila willistoni TaxID=7260 RepID=UPI000C26CBAE|nr:uncharacterized protein CG13380-like [Drosophila willistoni]
MNRCPHCSGTGYQPKRPKSAVRKRPQFHLNSYIYVDANDETNSVEAEADGNNKQIVHPNANRPECICHRPKHGYVCDRCHQYFHGRLAEICPRHKSEIYLMDFQRCPYCAAPNSMIQIAKFTSKEICKFENAELPGGDEGL